MSARVITMNYMSYQERGHRPKGTKTDPQCSKGAGSIKGFTAIDTMK
jgi:hypothetical protein